MGVSVTVCRNDKLSISDIENLSPDKIVISPGPGSPSESGISLKIIKQYAGKIPILGVCLGHQAIAQVFGASIVRASRVMHGKISSIVHKWHGVFYGLKNPINMIRYHSLIVDPLSLPACFDVTAWSETCEIMGIRHVRWNLEGIQFHPESILSEQGYQLLSNFVNR